MRISISIMWQFYATILSGARILVGQHNVLKTYGNGSKIGYILYSYGDSSKVYYSKYSFRFAEQVLNSKLSLKQEIEDIIGSFRPDFRSLSRPRFNELLRGEFTSKGWEDQPLVFNEPGDPAAKMDFLKERVGVEVEFGHSSFIGVDLLKFQVCSYSGLDKIDVGLYIVTTKAFQKRMRSDYNQNWDGSLSFEKVVKYLPHFKSAIQVPVYVIGLEI